MIGKTGTVTNIIRRYLLQAFAQYAEVRTFTIVTGENGGEILITEEAEEGKPDIRWTISITRDELPPLKLPA